MNSAKPIQWRLSFLDRVKLVQRLPTGTELPPLPYKSGRVEHICINYNHLAVKKLTSVSPLQNAFLFSMGGNRWYRMGWGVGFPLYLNVKPLLAQLSSLPEEKCHLAAEHWRDLKLFLALGISDHRTTANSNWSSIFEMINSCLSHFIFRFSCRSVEKFSF